MSEPEVPVALPRVAILGAGSMGGALLAGLVRPGVEAEGIAATVRTGARAETLRAPRVHVFAVEEDADANRAAVRGARVVVVAVKPAMVAAVLAEIADVLEPDALVVSIAAGVTTASMEALVPTAVLRAMPNTPALVGRGVTGVAAGGRADGDDLELARRVFATVGAVLMVPEERMDALTAISGSGPAYVFHSIEKWTAVALKLGFSRDEARLLVEQTFLGASELLAASGVDPAELRRRVTSPGGTTERAVAVLEGAALDDLYARAAAAAIARAKELGA